MSWREYELEGGAMDHCRLHHALLTIACCLLVSQAAPGHSKPKVLVLRGVTGAWNATRGVPGTVQVGNAVSWSVAAEPGDVLGIVVAPKKKADRKKDAAPGSWGALAQEGATLYYLYRGNEPELLTFGRAKDRYTLNQQVVGLTRINAARLEKMPKEEVARISYVEVHQLEPGQFKALEKLDGTRLIVSIKQAGVLSKLKSVNPYGVFASKWSDADLAALGQLSNLRMLHLRASKSVFTLASLAGLKNLSSLSAQGWEKLSDLRPLTKLSQLKSLRLSNCKEVKDFKPLTQLPNLVALNLEACQAKDVKWLASMGRLSVLWLPPASDQQLKQVVQWLPHLRAFYVIGGKLTDLAALSRLTHVETLALGKLQRVKDIGPLAQLKQLRTLFLGDAEQLQDFSPLGSLPQLRCLMVMDGKKKGADYSPLAKLTHLTVAVLPGSEDYRFLYGLGNLRRLYLPDKALKSPAVADLKKRLPRCEVLAFCMGSGWLILMVVGALVVGLVWRRRRRHDPA